MKNEEEKIAETKKRSSLSQVEHLEELVKEGFQEFIMENAVFTAELGKEGRLTFPKEEKEKLGLERGDLVQVVLRKVDAEEQLEVTFSDLRDNTLSEILFQEKEKTWDQIFEKLNEKVEVVLIAESPRSLSNYFYNAEETSKFRKKILDALIEKDFIADREGLETFIEKGFYLTDLFDEPIDEVPPRQNLILQHKERLIEEIKKIDPKKVVFMLPKGGFGQKENKFTRLAYYFKEVKGKEPSDFIKTQEEMAKALRKETGVPFEIEVAPYPNPYGRQAKEWKKRGIDSFLDWVGDNRGWLEKDLG